MSSFNTICASLLILGASLSANASAFVEPSIGYRTENLKLTDKSNVETKYSMASPVFGLKLGFRSQLGVDVNLAGDYATGKASISPLEEKNNFTHKKVAAELGISALGLMKIYLGYGFLNELKVEEGILNSEITLKGPAYHAGLQFQIFQGVYFTTQYSLNQYRSVEGKSFTNGESTDLYFNKLDSQDFSFTLSMIF